MGVGFFNHLSNFPAPDQAPMSGIPLDQSQLWLWIMDYLSSFPEIDVSILNALLETAPIDNIGETTTERFALRCLEEIFQFVPKNGLGNVAPPDMRVEFDLSLSCSDVLDQILQEVSFSNPTTTEQELLRWDIQPFIKHKRASLPECKLEQMKHLILEEGNNVLDGDGYIRTSSFKDDGDRTGLIDALPKGLSGDAAENNVQDYRSRSVNSTAVDGLQQKIDPSDAKADLLHPCLEQICENENGRPNIVAIKSRFLSLKGRLNRDPVGEGRQNLCVKCNQNGQVLVCSSSDCPVMVHESCLGSTAGFDDKGNFLCPFCDYSLLFSKCLEGKDRISLASKNLTALMELLAKIHAEKWRILPSH
ncbi:hypothetical protein V6N11_031080 [Hibiscus sabdariffa]|uniref:PHD-type domain-containing protein n=2 Tax=Hibiscus sabdariffa TaxID=183260 RepID=A0ABR1ZWT1_9ROSI